MIGAAQVRTQFRKIFTQMGFDEMPTNAYVESSFWNFDALFQPQQHPARDAHDTFFLTGARAPRPPPAPAPMGLDPGTLTDFKEPPFADTLNANAEGSTFVHN